MTIDRMVLVFAGFVVLLGVTLAWLVNPWWILLSAFAGLNMMQAAFTGFCPPEILLRKLSANNGKACCSKATESSHPKY